MTRAQRRERAKKSGRGAMAEAVGLAHYPGDLNWPDGAAAGQGLSLS